MRRHSTALLAALTLAAAALPARAQTVGATQFVNGLAIAGNTPDLSSGSAFDRRLGFFSDLYYDAGRKEWWALSDRGPGGGVLSYETRAHRFTVDLDANTGAISNFQLVQTVKFMGNGAPLNGQAPSPTNVLGNAFDPEGIVVNPLTGNLLVSDEYGPSLLEFDRDGNLLRRFTTPANLVPRSGSGVPNFASDAGNTLGKRTNRGFEGLAISPDGRYAYAMLQSAMLDEGGSNGTFARIVKFDVGTGTAVAQYAYELETSARGRGISALVALGDDKFLVLERNNRGLGVEATIAAPEKLVYEISLAGATDVTAVPLGATTLPAGVVGVRKADKRLVLNLGANTLAEIGNKVPEKWEGLAVGPQLADGRYALLAGTDNDYSVTQNGAGTQFDVYVNFGAADPYASSIQCPLGQTTGCVRTSDGQAAALPANYALIPGVLHAYRAEITGYVTPAVVPEPATLGLTMLGAGLIGIFGRRRARAG